MPDDQDDFERRRTPPYTLRELEEHIDERIRLRLREHAEEDSRALDKRFDELKRLLISAFPGGDPERHRQYHDEVMQYLQERREVFKSVKEKTITALLWAVLVGIGTAVWHTVKAKLGGG